MNGKKKTPNKILNKIMPIKRKAFGGTDMPVDPDRPLYSMPQRDPAFYPATNTVPDSMAPQPNPNPSYDLTGQNAVAVHPSMNDMRFNNPNSRSDQKWQTLPDDGKPKEDRTDSGTNVSANWKGQMNGQKGAQIDTANMFAGAMQLAADALPNTTRKNNLQPLSLGEQRDPYGVRGSGATFESGGQLSPQEMDSFNAFHIQQYQKYGTNLGGDTYNHGQFANPDLQAWNGSHPNQLIDLQRIQGASGSIDPLGKSPQDMKVGPQTMAKNFMRYQTQNGDKGPVVDYGTNQAAATAVVNSWNAPSKEWQANDQNIPMPMASAIHGAGHQVPAIQKANWHTDEDTDYSIDSVREAKSGIHIKPENKGKFTAYKNRTGKTTEEALHSKDPHVRKMANFAKNAKKWKHGEDGLDMDYYDEDFMDSAAQGIRMLGDGKITPMSDSPNPMYKFEGPSHAEGGIPLEYGGSTAEVQGGETAHVSPIDGSFHVDGAMKMPNLGEVTKGLAGRSFQAIGKEIGTRENKASNMAKKANDIISNSNPSNKFDSLAMGSAMALNDASSQNLSAIEAQKQHIANIQESMRAAADSKGIDNKKAHTLFGKNGLKMAVGGTVSPDVLAYQKDLMDKHPDWVDEAMQQINPKTNKPWGLPKAGKFDDGVDGPRTQYVKNYIQGKQATSSGQDQFIPYVNRWDEQVDNVPQSPLQPVASDSQSIVPNQATVPGMPPINYNYTDDSKHYASLSEMNKVRPTDFLSAARYLFETPDPVPTGQINPNLKVPYQISLQDRLNQNQSTFNAISKQNPNNYAALSSLAAQKYDADNNVLGEEFRANQGIASQTSNDNTAIMNEAQRANVQLNMEQLYKQSMAKSNTEAHKAQALASISDHINTKAYENMNIQLDEMKYGYRPYRDPDGNLKLEYTGPNAFLAGTPYGTAAKEDVTKEYDADGNLTKTTKKSTSKWGGMFPKKKRA